MTLEISELAVQKIKQHVMAPFDREALYHQRYEFFLRVSRSIYKLKSCKENVFELSPSWNKFYNLSIENEAESPRH